MAASKPAVHDRLRVFMIATPVHVDVEPMIRLEMSQCNESLLEMSIDPESVRIQSFGVLTAMPRERIRDRGFGKLSDVLARGAVCMALQASVTHRR